MTTAERLGVGGELGMSDIEVAEREDLRLGVLGEDVVMGARSVVQYGWWLGWQIVLLESYLVRWLFVCLG
jgi:hypothetical protein